MSGYRHSGLSEKDYEDRRVLIDALEVVGRRWDTAISSMAADVLRELSEEVGNDPS